MEQERNVPAVPGAARVSKANSIALIIAEQGLWTLGVIHLTAE
jgi:hypothetical protein